MAGEQKATTEVQPQESTEKREYPKDNREMTLIKKTSKKGNVYYSIMVHKEDGSVEWDNERYATVSKAGHIALRKSE